MKAAVRKYGSSGDGRVGVFGTLVGWVHEQSYVPQVNACGPEIRRLIRTRVVLRKGALESFHRNMRKFGSRCAKVSVECTLSQIRSPAWVIIYASYRGVLNGSARRREITGKASSTPCISPTRHG